MKVMLLDCFVYEFSDGGFNSWNEVLLFLKRKEIVVNNNFSLKYSSKVEKLDEREEKNIWIKIFPVLEIKSVASLKTIHYICYTGYVNLILEKFKAQLLPVYSDKKKYLKRLEQIHSNLLYSEVHALSEFYSVWSRDKEINEEDSLTVKKFFEIKEKIHEQVKLNPIILEYYSD